MLCVRSLKLEVMDGCEPPCAQRIKPGASTRAVAFIHRAISPAPNDSF